MQHIVLITGRNSYRTGDYVEAAAALRAATTIATNADTPLGDDVVTIDFADPDAAAETIATSVPGADAVIALDDEGVVIAGRTAQVLGLPHNPASALAATRDKLAMRRRMRARGVAQPDFRAAGPGDVPVAARAVGFPVVVKPTGLAASQGVIRADTTGDARLAEERVRTILDDRGDDPDQPLLVEAYVPGSELSIDGVLRGGELNVLAVIDKPAPLAGPYFEETLFVTPSRHPEEVIEDAVRLVEAGIAALGLEHGPVHAEVRLADDGGPRLIEIAARTIGGLCGRALTFGLIGESLETLVLRGALGLPAVDTAPALPATGVLMLPIPATGFFTGVSGTEDASAVPGVTGVSITAPPQTRVVALPEGDRYLGFVFAAGVSADEVEESLRSAAAVLTVTIDGEEVRPVLAAGSRFGTGVS